MGRRPRRPFRWLVDRRLGLTAVVIACVATSGLVASATGPVRGPHFALALPLTLSNGASVTGRVRLFEADSYLVALRFENDADAFELAKRGRGGAGVEVRPGVDASFELRSGGSVIAEGRAATTIDQADDRESWLDGPTMAGLVLVGSVPGRPFGEFAFNATMQRVDPGLVGRTCSLVVVRSRFTEWQNTIVGVSSLGLACLIGGGLLAATVIALAGNRSLRTW